MTVTSIRSLGSRAMRTDIARGFGVADGGGLVPCICKTPCWDIRCRYVRRKPVPRPLVTPEVALEARDLREAHRDQPMASRLCRWLGEAIGVDITRRSQVSRDLAASSDAATGCRQCPKVDGRHLLTAPGKQPNVRVCQRNLIKNESVVSAVIKIKKRYRA